MPPFPPLFGIWEEKLKQSKACKKMQKSKVRKKTLKTLNKNKGKKIWRDVRKAKPRKYNAGT